MEKPVLNAKEAAKLLGVGRSKIYQLCKSNEFPVMKLGKCIRISREDLMNWIKMKMDDKKAKF